LKRAVLTPGAPAPVGPYSQAIVSGGFVFASGQIPLDPATGKLVEGGFEAQAERVLDNLRAVLEAAGASLDGVVRTNVFLTDLSLFPRLNAVYGRYFTGDPKPARSTIGVAALPLGAQLEIEAVAALARPT
jgi:2-iminobutanoate/2-iminopropanoate deaminase